MSAYTNSNYAPPPPTMGQMNMINGLPQQQNPPVAQQHQPPQTPQQQQIQQMQLTGSQMQQQHQNILQQKQQQQYHPGPLPPMLNNMSKYMPPSASATGLQQQSTAATSAGIGTATNLAYNALNGPRAAATGGVPPPTSTTTTQVPPANIPPHLRPTGMNGPPVGATISTAGTPLTNGGGGNFSANSSRTGSPALPNSPSHHNQQQQQYPPAVGGVAKQPPLSSLPRISSMPKFEPSSNTSAAAPPLNSAASGLTSSMQNLSINRTNGPSTQSLQQPPATAASANSFSSNIQSNFRTSALNMNPLQQPQQQNSATSFATNRPPPTMPPTTAPYQQFTSQAAQQQLAKPQTVPTTASQQPSSIYGTSTAPPMMRPPQVGQQNVGYGPPTAGMMPPPPPTNVLQQNQINNNQVQQSFGQQQQQQQQLQAAPPPIQQARKPMYPTSSQLPPLPTPQQQQQQPYSQAYHQQQQQQPATFNGQTNSAPLQYQSMQQAQQQQQQQYPNSPNYNPQMNVVQQGFSRLWGQDTVDLMQNRHILTPATLPIPKIALHNQFHESINCNPSIMRCTIAKIPESNSLLQKSRLPLGILIHPFRDVNSLPVIQCPNIVRCRLCRTYINPFVYFVDSKMWKCNLCYRVNELPDDFQFDPATKTYGDVTRRPEVRSSTIEFIAPSEYMLRPPQPAIYLFLFDVSIIAQQSGYLENICAVLSKHLDDMPGDARTQVGFIAYNSQLHFYSMAEGYNQPHEMTLLDIDDAFLPRPDNLLVNLKECKELIKDLLTQLPKRYADTHDPGSALGAALQVAYKLMQASGGRVTVFQTCLPNKGPGALEPREDPNNRSAKDVAHLNPATDFYKRFALECSGYQIAVDLFLLNQQYSDLATISGVSKHSGGCVHHFPLYQNTKPHHIDSLRQCFKRYLVRKIGFEAVMRIRCTRGLQVHTFHGNFFVRSTDLLSLPNVNPDAGYGMQISYEESLTDVKTICFQAALLYTNSEGERRIRVHTLCLPVTASLPEVMHAADTEAIIGLLSKMAVDRSITSNIADAREAFINATVDILSAFKIAQNLPSGQTGQLIAPRSLALMPLYILSLLKHPAFRVGTSTRLDDRVFAMDCMKTLPLDQLMKFIYPELYQIDALFFNAQNSNNTATEDDDDDDLPDIPRLQLSAEYLDSRSIFLLDCGNLIIIYVGLNVPVNILENVLGIKSTAELPDYYYGLPAVNSAENDLLKRFIMRLNDDKPYPPVVQIIRDTSTAKPQFIEKLVDDRSESSLSYYEFLQHIRTQVK